MSMSIFAVGSVAEPPELLYQRRQRAFTVYKHYTGTRVQEREDGVASSCFVFHSAFFRCPREIYQSYVSSGRNTKTA